MTDNQNTPTNPFGQGAYQPPQPSQSAQSPQPPQPQGMQPNSTPQLGARQYHSPQHQQPVTQQYGAAQPGQAPQPSAPQLGVQQQYPTAQPQAGQASAEQYGQPGAPQYGQPGVPQAPQSPVTPPGYQPAPQAPTSQTQYPTGYASAPPPQGQQYQTYTPGQAPQASYQGYPGAAAPQPKKKKTGLIVGVVVGVVLLIAAAVAIPLVVLNPFGGTQTTAEAPDDDPADDPADDTKDDTSGEADINTVMPDADDPSEEPNTTDSASYTNSKIGIGFDVPDGWYEHESETYPDEVLEVWPEDKQDLSFVWVDRFPDASVSEYEASDEMYMKLYSFDGDYDDLVDFKKDSFTKSGQKWTVVSFNTHDESGAAGNGDQWYYVMCCYTDMPDSQGLLMVAEFVPVDAPEDVVTEESFEEITGIIDSFVFL